MTSDSLTTLRHRLSRAPSVGAILLVLALGVALTACGDDGMALQPPTIAGSIDNQSLNANDNPVEFNLGDVFEGQELTFSASSSDTGIATASVSGTTLTVNPQSGGSATVTVTAENNAGTEEVSFTVDVLGPPTTVGSIDNQNLNADDDPVEFNLGDVFEGQELTFSASSSDTGIATASVSGTTLTVGPQNGGSATVTVTAENDAGTEELSFTVDVNLPDGPPPPGS
jgi:hypothetical protein